MGSLDFGIASCAAWAPGRETLADWCRWAEVETVASEPVTSTPPVLLRRRVSPLGQQALKAAWGMPNLGESCFVFASRHGEFDRTTALLRAVASRQEASPADFSLSVHNALTGLLSIASRNLRGHTTITAGAESFCFGLLEAAVRVTERPDEASLLVFYDAPLFAPFDELMTDQPEHPEPLAVVLGLCAPGKGRWSIELALEADPGARSVAAPALDFLRLLLAGHGQGHAAGERRVWRWAHA